MAAVDSANSILFKRIFIFYAKFKFHLLLGPDQVPKVLCMFLTYVLIFYKRSAFFHVQTHTIIVVFSLLVPISKRVKRNISLLLFFLAVPSKEGHFERKMCDTE